MRRSRDIRARAEASEIALSWEKSGRCMPTVSLSTGMNSACASQIRLRSDSPFLETLQQTDRQTPLLYIYRRAPMPGFARVIN